MQEAQIATRQFVTTRKDTAKMLNVADKVFGQISFMTAPSVISTRLSGIAFGWNNVSTTDGIQLQQLIGNGNAA